MTEKIFLLDGHSLAHRAFYALPLLTNSEGEYTNAVFGFSRMLFKLLDEENPDLLTVAFDRKAPTFRHEEYEEYKATRKKMPEELTPQIGLIKKLLEYLNIPLFEIDGYEADDIIGTLAREAADNDLEVVIVTGDRDALQLVDDNIQVMYTRKGISDIVMFDEEKVREKYELEPEQLVDRKGLMGDNSDNIPGVPGIGPKTALKLLKEYDNLENVLDNIEQISGKKRKENLRKYSEQARMSKMLGEILTDVPLDIDLEDCRMGDPNHEQMVELFKRLEFKSLLDRFQKSDLINTENIEIQEVTTKKKLQELTDSIAQQGEVGIGFQLDNYQRPVRAEIEAVMVALSADEVYLLQEKEIEGQLQTVLEDETINKYMLHAKEIMVVLKDKQINVSGVVYDPLLLYYLLHPSEKSPRYEELFGQYLNIEIAEEMDSGERMSYFLSSLFTICEKLLPELRDKKLLELYHEIEAPLLPVLAEMEYNGIKLDKDYLQELSSRWQQKLDEITEEVYELAGEEFNLNSPKQLGEILFDKLGLPVIKKTKTGYSTSVKVLEELEGEHDIIPLIMEFRQWSKLISTYVKALPPLINPDTGRIHTSFNQMVTATGRLSSTDPNLQNIPIRTREGREIRKAFVPQDKDWLLLAADYSQVELRVLAEISSDSNLKEAFNSGQDIHNQTASGIFAVEPEEVTAGMRRKAKVINFGIAYGMSAYGLARDLNISRQEAEEYIERYFERFQGVKQYMEQIKKQAREQGYVTTIFNRRRYIPDIKSRNFHKRRFAERTAINTPIQGTAADIMKLAMIDVYQALCSRKSVARLLLQVHDELVLEVKKDKLEEIAGLIKEKMEAAAELSVPLIADLQVGKNWRDKQDYEVK